MSADRLERDLAELPDGGGPPEGWEGRVLARVRVAPPPAPVRRAPFVAALVGASAVAASSIVFFWVERDRPAPAHERRVEQLVEDMERLERDLHRLMAEKDRELQKMLVARTEEERAALRAALEARNAAIAAKRQALQKQRTEAAGSGGGRAPRKDSHVNVKCDPNDPLCGI